MWVTRIDKSLYTSAEHLHLSDYIHMVPHPLAVWDSMKLSKLPLTAPDQAQQASYLGIHTQ